MSDAEYYQADVVAPLRAYEPSQEDIASAALSFKASAAQNCPNGTQGDAELVGLEVLAGVQAKYQFRIEKVAAPALSDSDRVDFGDSATRAAVEELELHEDGEP